MRADQLLNYTTAQLRNSQLRNFSTPQLLNSATSQLRNAANYEEADDGTSDRDKLAKRKIVLRELKETRFRLLVLRRSGLILEAHDLVIQECNELRLIVAKLVRKAQTPAPKPKQSTDNLEVEEL